MKTNDLKIASIVEMTMSHALAVVEGCRHSDVQAWRPFHFHEDDDTFAVNRWSATGVKRALLDEDGRAIAVGGLTLVAPRTWTAWMVAVPGWEHEARHAIRFSRALLCAMFERGEASRVQAWVLASDQRALRFATRSMGFSIECLCEKYVGGVDYYQLRRLS